jgi:hypothetical protein
VKIYDIMEYQRSQKRAKELKSLLFELDSVADVLYNNINYNGVWDLLQHFEEVRIKYYVEFYEHDKIVQDKGKINE